MSFLATHFSLFAALALGSPVQEPAPTEEPFPPSTAMAEGVSPEALAGLSELVQSFVDDEEIVGAELLVIKNGHSILHEAFGRRDQEAQLPLETGSVFCVRSMTKPLIGTSILMLVDEDLVELDDPVAKYLPAFDVEGSSDITIEHLITHTSGLPMSLLLGKDLHELDGIQAVAELGAGHELLFEPGSSFSYADQGTDTLTALIEVVSGMPAADFVRTRLLEPLGMQDTACVMTEDSPLRPRAISKYVGTRGAWTRFWSPTEPPLFPFFLGSQGLYSTLEDYARFMQFWRSKGRAESGRLLTSRSVRKALTPGPHSFGSPSGFPGLRGEYGFQMQLWARPGEEGKKPEVVVFGHTGSDGTYAWVFPEQKAMVLYFTQSRNNTSGLRVEEALGGLLLGAPYDPNLAAPPFEQYLGYYWEGEGDRYRAIIRDSDDLALEVPGRGIVPLSYIGEDRWKMRPNPSVVLAFQRSEAGEVTGYRIGDHEEYRFDPSGDLPSADELAARVAEVHRMDLAESLGPIRMNSTLVFEELDRSGEVSTLLAWPDRFRVDTVAGEEFEHLTFDGEQVRYESRAQPASTLEGTRAESTRLASPFVLFGDWRRSYPELEVIQRLTVRGEEVFLVRTGDTSAAATTLCVEAQSGRVVLVANVTQVENQGRVGQFQYLSDFRDVSGMLLPFRTETELALPYIGKIVTTVTDIELGAELPDGVFELGE